MAAPERETESLKEEAKYIKKTQEINPNESSRAQIKRLEAEKVLLEEEIQRLTLTLPEEFRDFRKREHFLDEEGFPRGDIDIYNIRHTRVTLLQKHEDLRKIMKQLDTALQEVFKAISERKKEKKEDKMVSKEPKTKKSVATSTTDEIKQVAKSKPSLWTLEPFYRVESVVENSPSHQCGLKTGDHIVRFGTIRKENFTQASLVHLVQNSINRAIEVVLRRNPEGIVELRLVPQTWDGRGVLGCRFVNM